MSGNPVPQVILLKSGLPVPIYNVTDVHGTKYFHDISEALPTHEGVYTASATNELGAAQSTALISVYVTRRAPEFKQTPLNVTLLEGSDHVINALVTGLPKPHVNVTNGEGELVGVGQMRMVEDNTWEFTQLLTYVQVNG